MGVVEEDVPPVRDYVTNDHEQLLKNVKVWNGRHHLKSLKLYSQVVGE